MWRAIRNLILLAAAIVVAAGCIFVARSADPVYSFLELLNYPRYGRYDALIREVGKNAEVDPMLIKAVIWHESGFRPDKMGRNGERGLMQVTEAAASDWARQNKRVDFVATDLFTPKVNMEAGTWYLKKALQRYAGKDDPVTFALAEYNAGKSRVDKWMGNTAQGTNANAGDLRGSISFPSTRNYVETIVDRYHFYQRQGKL